MYKHTYFSAILLLALLTISCLQHKYSISVLEDGTVQYQYTASGDSSDLYDEYTILPSGEGWTVSDSVEIDTTDSGIDTIYHYTAYKEFAPDKNRLEIGFSEGEEYLQNPLQVSKSDLFFMVNYRVEMDFRGRRFAELYGNPDDFVPEEYRDMDLTQETDDSLKALAEAKISEGYSKWAVNLLKRRFLEALHLTAKEAGADLGSAPLELVSSALDSFLQVRLSAYETAEEFPEKRIWSDISGDGFKLIADKITIKTDNYISLLRVKGDFLHRKYAVTDDLSDDSFEIALRLPGTVRSSNADSLKGNFLRWEFNGEVISDSTYHIAAISTIYRNERIYIAGGILVIVLILIVRRIFVQRKPDAKDSNRSGA